MNEYINREVVLSKCADIWNNADETTQTGVNTINTIDKITDYIESLPAADVQPVKHGKWITLAIVPATVTGNSILARCSICEDTLTYTVMGREITLKYCSNCGARMDLKE